MTRGLYVAPVGGKWRRRDGRVWPATVDPDPDPEPDVGTVYMVPPEIDQTGATNVAAALNSFLASVPDGTEGNPSIIRFQPGAHYRIDSDTIGTRRWNESSGYNRHWWVLDGNGCTLDKSQVPAPDPPGNNDRAGIGLHYCHNVLVKGFTVLGQHPDPCLLPSPESTNNCTGGYREWYETHHGIALWGCRDTTVRNCFVFNSYGDGLNADHANDFVSGDRRAINVTFENCLVDGTGRHGVSATANDGLYVRECIFDRISYHVVSVEPEAFSSVLNVTMEDNIVKRHYLAMFIAVSGGDQPRGNFIIRNNVMEKSGTTSFPAIQIARTHDAEVYNVTVEGNSIERWDNGGDAGVGGRVAMAFDGVDGLYVIGNDFNQFSTDEAAISLRETVTPMTDVVIRENLAPNVPHIYWLGLVPHGSSSEVTACGNTTAVGTNQPTACI